MLVSPVVKLRLKSKLNKASLYTIKFVKNFQKGSLTFHSVMGNEMNSSPVSKCEPVGPDGKKLKPCCACPETKRIRDECIMEKGEENCRHLIEAHKACMRSLGFNI